VGKLPTSGAKLVHGCSVLRNLSIKDFNFGRRKPRVRPKLPECRDVGLDVLKISHLGNPLSTSPATTAYQDLSARSANWKGSFRGKAPLTAAIIRM
jgi:hypothetical protein